MKKLLLTISLLIFFSALACTPDKQEKEIIQNTAASSLNQKETQYYSNGRKLYRTICANCHMENGSGLGRLIPPLVQSNYLVDNRTDLSRIIKYGLSGPIRVDGEDYNQPMPANPGLTDLEIAMILTYVGNTWGNNMGGFTLEEVQQGLSVN
ncbi:MAG: cytochrome c551 [Roseivirga sp.]|jgi:cytochrome c551